MEIFGQNLYFELQKHPNIKGQEVLNLKLIELSEKLGVPLVATNDCHYIHQEDAEAQEILLCVQTQKTILDKERKLSMIDSPDFYLKSSEEMTGMFIQYPAAIENTAKIAKMCDLEIETGKWVVPKFDVPGNKTSEEYLKNLVYKNLKERYPHPTKEIKERVEYELSVIFQKHYTTYFLIVYDLKKWAREQGIAAGPGRGSVADLDFADDRRDEVIAYVTKKYGEDKVAQIITFGTMEARGSVRDVGRALGMPYSGPDRIAKLIPHGAQGFAMTIEKALEQNPELSGAYKNEPEIKRLLDLARIYAASKRSARRTHYNPVRHVRFRLKCRKSCHWAFKN
ncbi:MAG: hypothetical protein HYW64_01415 [Candidatus Levybacteria bacterium]|nr:hypothetical protein [Candidatus Levybacteria bacterium]